MLRYATGILNQTGCQLNQIFLFFCALSFFFFFAQIFCSDFEFGEMAFHFSLLRPLTYQQKRVPVKLNQTKNARDGLGVLITMASWPHG